MRFYFHIRDNDTFIEDDEGIYLPNLEAATDEAWASVSDLLEAEIKLGHGVTTQVIEMADEQGRSIGIFGARKLLH